MKVLVTKKLMSEDIAYIRARIDSRVELIFPEQYDEYSILKNAGEAVVLLGGFFTEKILKNAPKLRFIQIPWTGVDNLNFDALKKYKISLCNSHSNAFAVAEHAVAMMMDAAKKLSYHDRQMRSGNWNRLFPGTVNPVSPFSKKISKANIGFIGFGAISRCICDILKGFHCSYFSFTRSGKIPVEYQDRVTALKFPEYYANARILDFLFIAVPLTSETEGIIDAKFLDVMSDQAILINISRGQVLSPGALYKALFDRKIGGAAIDTWYNYPSIAEPRVFPSPDFPFQELDNILLSPHRAGYLDSGFPHLDDAIENINSFVEGLPIKNIVSLENKY